MPDDVGAEQPAAGGGHHPCAHLRGGAAAAGAWVCALIHLLFSPALTAPAHTRRWASLAPVWALRGWPRVTRPRIKPACRRHAPRRGAGSPSGIPPRAHPPLFWAPLRLRIALPRAWSVACLEPRGRAPRPRRAHSTHASASVSWPCRGRAQQSGCGLAGRGKRAPAPPAALTLWVARNARKESRPDRHPRRSLFGHGHFLLRAAFGESVL